MRIVGIYLFIVLLTACGSAEPADAPLESLAATITVTTTADEFNRDGDCSLREAMVAVVSGRPVDGCGAKTVGHTIVLAQNETYFLRTKHSQTGQLDGGNTQVASALPYVTTRLTIKGNGSRLKGAPAKYRRAPRLNLLAIGESGVLRLENLTLEGGYTASEIQGGAITNYGELTGTDVTVTKSVSRAAPTTYPTKSWSAGGIYNRGKVVLSRCKFTDNYATSGAAALFSKISTEYQDDADFPEAERPYVHFDECLFEGNKTDTGVAAIRNDGYGRMMLERSAVVKNEVLEHPDFATEDDDNEEHVAAIIQNDSLYSDKDRGRARPAMLMENVTLSLNLGQVYSAFTNLEGTAQIRHSTIYKNHAYDGGAFSRGIFDGANLSLSHTVLADHRPERGSAKWGDCYTIYNNRWPVTSLGHNFESDGSCRFGAASDIHERRQWAALLPLADNGGFTPTHQPLPAWSKLWNAGAAVGDTRHGTDQRGEPRIDGNEADIGAHEACNDIGIVWVLIFPIPYCLEPQEPLKLNVPLGESAEDRVGEERLEMFRAPCEACYVGIGLTKASRLHFELSEEAFERARVEAILLYDAEGEVIADGDRGLEVELSPGRYYLEVSGEAEEGAELPAAVFIMPL